jgi:DNA modification methylase
MLEANKIYNLDCIEGMSMLESESIDGCVTDPPFNIGLKYDNHMDSMKEHDFWIWIEAVFREIYRVLKPKAHLTFTCAQIQIWKYKPLLENMGFVFRHLGVWHNPQRKAGSWPGQWPYSWEPIMDFTKGKFKKLNNRNCVGFMDVWIEKTPPKIDHPARRPVRCWDDIVKLVSNHGDLVLDPFCGSGTTPHSCIKLKRNFMCFEISEKYCNDATLRTQYIQSSLL